MSLNQEEEERARSDFVLGMLFHIHELFPGADNAAALVMGKDGLYVLEHIEACWRGFAMAKGQENAQLQRFDATRYITPGMVTQINSHLPFKLADEQLHEVIRAVLHVVGDSPS